MSRSAFVHVDTWVFDLDDTLYPPESRLFDQVRLRMTDWLMEMLALSRAEADALRHQYWRDHGTTLAGLMHHHGMEPRPFLDHVHRVDMSGLRADPALADAIAALPGRRIVYTNGTETYAHQVLDRLGLSHLFDAVYGVEHASFRPKPEVEAFRAVFDLDGLVPTRATMFEDTVVNLRVPHDMGMRTVHVAPVATPANHIHHHTDDLTAFLRQVTH